jgi:Na+/phosphate symporter
LQFKANDQEYIEITKKINKTNKELKELKAVIDKVPENFALFIDMLENLDTVLAAILPKFAING